MFDAIDRRELERKIDCSRAAGATLHFVPIATLDRMIQELAEQEKRIAELEAEK